MTTQEINRILAEFEGKVFHPLLDYTTDWDEFHRVWMNRHTMNKTDYDYVVNSIANESTPFYAALRLAEILKNKER